MLCIASSKSLFTICTAFVFMSERAQLINVYYAHFSTSKILLENILIKTPNLFTIFKTVRKVVWHLRYIPLLAKLQFYITLRIVKQNKVVD